MLTPELLQALLSPDSGIRSQAETVYQSISVKDRIQALMTQLLLICTTTTTTIMNHCLC